MEVGGRSTRRPRAERVRPLSVPLALAQLASGPLAFFRKRANGRRISGKHGKRQG